MAAHTNEIASWREYHAELKANPERWVAGTSDHKAWTEAELCSGTCDVCHSTVTIGLAEARAAGASV